jgi:hypothetical protein
VTRAGFCYFLVVAAACTALAPANAQVGYEPRRSPFRDLELTQEVSVFTGYYKAKRDPARVAPQSGPITGMRYQWRASGPAHLTAELSRVGSQRRVLDPEQPESCPPNPAADCKLVDTFRWPVYFADAGVSLDLTGARSFHHLVPDVRAGIGLASDFHTKADVGDFAFGTRFAINWGAGIRWVPGGPYQVRLDLSNHFYSVRYPETYYRPASDNTQVLAPRQKKSVWLNNPALSIGFSYLFSR